MLSSGQKIIIGVVAGVVVTLFGAIFIFGRTPSLPAERVELTVWGVNDSSGTIQNLANDFTKYLKGFDMYRNINISVRYTELPEDQYEEILLNALAEDRGPDIFYIHNTWLPRYQTKLAALPLGNMTVDQYRATFVPVASNDLTYQDRIYAFPMYIDTLALYYNKQYYQGAATARSYPQQTWDGLLQDAAALAITGEDGALSRGGVAMGTAETVTNAADIFLMLIKQAGGDICDWGCTNITVNETVNGVRPAATAIDTYLSFADVSWTDDLVGNSPSITSDIDAFAEGKVGAIIGYRDTYDVLKKKTELTNVSFGIAEIPQLVDPELTQSHITYANYFAPAVSVKSTHQREAWQLLTYMSSIDASAKYHTATGRPTSRQDLITVQQSESDTGIFAMQSKYATSIHAYDYHALIDTVRELLDEASDRDLTPAQALIELGIAAEEQTSARRFLKPPKTGAVTNSAVTIDGSDD